MSALAKVCGLVRPEDAAFAAGQGADLLGFVFHEPSPRNCADLTVAAPHLDRAVLVMVAQHAEAILATARRHGFQKVQPYLPAVAREAGVRLLREAGLQVLLPWPDELDQAPVSADLYLWESSPQVTGVAGGSGMGHAMAHPPPGPFLLAGGLDATNLRERVQGLPAPVRKRFLGVDAASRLEASPGEKDPSKVSAFILAAHALEHP
ncbi:MAG: phosphoribosylanthranilate isomerase [Geothrix sp.]|uniref:phosphoribosylanthranilate isomerase n=1 Tax=Geothrix sp. TaxID=1962974 RepID=UPI001842C8E1|nr:phosphoribosylanthranilate isomerase [Geothrix sp.]NWJ39589.1 phosphoribosylanthranilate isomerase [Geothrix sp.]WIL22388.1 MAG: phosphoribosylanthranilate isomerase [Geothrix sp.]